MGKVGKTEAISKSHIGRRAQRLELNLSVQTIIPQVPNVRTHQLIVQVSQASADFCPFLMHSLLHHLCGKGWRRAATLARKAWKRQEGSAKKTVGNTYFTRIGSRHLWKDNWRVLSQTPVTSYCTLSCHKHSQAVT